MYTIDAAPPTSHDPPAYQPSPSGSAPESPKEKPAGYYIYYRVYTPDGALTALTAYDPSNPFVGRVKSSSVPPPHNALSIKRRLGEAEGICSAEKGALYATCFSSAQLQDGFIAGRLGQDLGATPETALGLVVTAEAFGKGNVEKRMAKEKSLIDYRWDYVYYRLHTLTGTHPSKHAFDPLEPDLGRIDRLAIAPPMDVRAFKACVARAEGKHIYAYADLYGAINGDEHDQTPRPNERPLTPCGVLASLIDSVGTSPETPFRLVQPMREAGVSNRPLRVVEAQKGSRVAFWNFSERWLAVSASEIVETDGVAKKMEHYDSKEEREGYFCVKANGDKGYVLKEGTVFLDVD
ncbi:hypothetical protein MKEN_01321000 [Mycena kentingensis (nom. inval.)]|nr:hypothetical protein MKEN_01321000 [Mycena kentingensis (nom. inval.)]